jgi:diguanylate cyclase (GGDEF)-like protein/PAS domain S-box-containing protein
VTLRRLISPLVVLTLLAGTLLAMNVAEQASGLESAAVTGILSGLLTLAIGFLLLMQSRRRRFAEKLVDERTAALAESEARFRLLADNSTDWITRHRPDGTWNYVSPACRELLGYEPEELVGRSPYEFVHFRDRARLRWTNRAQIADPEVHTVAYRFRAKDARWVWLEAKSQGVTDPETGELVEVQCATRDISERVLSERELRRQGRFLEIVLDSLGAGVVACDADGRITLVNRAMREIRGLGLDAEVAADWLARETVYHPDGGMLRRHELPVVRALGGEKINDEELVMVRPDGEARAVLANARPITGEDGELLGAVNAMQDITERLHAEEYVHESERRFRALAENAPVGIYEADPRGWRRFVNDAWQQIAGIGAEEALGDGWTRAIHPEDREAVIAEWDLAGRLGRDFDAEFRFVRPDGEVVWAWSKAHKLTEAYGQTTGYIGTCIDITERKAADELRLRWEKTFTHTRRGISVTDPETDLVESVNPAFAAMHGGSVKDFVGKPLTSMFTRDSAARITAVFDDGQDGGFVTYEADHVRLDGSTLPVAAEVVEACASDDGRPYRIAYYTDLTEQRRAEAERRETEERFQLAFDEAPIGMALQTLDGRFVKVNRALCEITGYPGDQLEATTQPSLTHPDDLKADAEAARRLLSGELRAYRSEKRYIRSDGEPIAVDLQVTVVRDAKGAPLHFLIQVQDITERKDYEERLRHLADHDALTGLLNRRRFEEELERELSSSARYGTGGALLALDLDNFKYVNDSMGHAVGDDLIARVGELLRARLRKSDVIARLGGDEFAVILPQVDEAQARTVADGLLEAVRADGDLRVGGHDHRITFSIGIAMFDHRAEATTGKLLVEADIAMYDAKEAGRDRAMLYDATHHRHESMHARLTWADRIRGALDNDGFVLHAQPIVSLEPDPAPRYELLIRMKGENGELIQPGTFLYVAERFELVQQIDRWVVRSAVALLAEEQKAGRDVRFEVNLSAKSVTDPDFPGFIERELLEAEIDPGRLCFEVTETAAIVNVDRAKTFAKRIASLGCQFALDDFGAGFASFYYLKHLHFDYLKIDGEFVRDLVGSRTNQLVVRSVVDIARGLGKQTIAEFVEDDETLAILRDYGVDFAQGFGIAKPTAVDGMEFTTTALPL